MTHLAALFHDLMTICQQKASCKENSIGILFASSEPVPISFDCLQSSLETLRTGNLNSHWMIIMPGGKMEVSDKASSELQFADFVKFIF